MELYYPCSENKGAGQLRGSYRSISPIMSAVVEVFDSGVRGREFALYSCTPYSDLKKDTLTPQNTG